MPVVKSPQPPSVNAIISHPGCRVQIVSTEDGGYSFKASIFIGNRASALAYADGMDVYYSPDVRTQLGWVLATGNTVAPEDGVLMAPYYNALADMKVVVDVGISLLAPHIGRLAKTHLLVSTPRGRLELIPSPERPTPAAENLAAAMYEANHPGSTVLSGQDDISFMAALCASSELKADFMSVLLNHDEGESLVGIYRRMAKARVRVNNVYSGLTALSDLRYSMQQAHAPNEFQGISC